MQAIPAITENRMAPLMASLLLHIYFSYPILFYRLSKYSRYIQKSLLQAATFSRVFPIIRHTNYILQQLPLCVLQWALLHMILYCFVHLAHFCFMDSSALFAAIAFPCNPVKNTV